MRSVKTSNSAGGMVVPGDACRPELGDERLELGEFEVETVVGEWGVWSVECGFGRRSAGGEGFYAGVGLVTISVRLPPPRSLAKGTTSGRLGSPVLVLPPVGRKRERSSFSPSPALAQCGGDFVLAAAQDAAGVRRRLAPVEDHRFGAELLRTGATPAASSWQEGFDFHDLLCFVGMGRGSRWIRRSGTD